MSVSLSQETELSILVVGALICIMQEIIFPCSWVRVDDSILSQE